MTRGLAWDETVRFDPAQPRDRDGRWGSGGGVAVLDRPAAAVRAAPASPEVFAAAFEKAFAGSPYTAFVNHYTPAQIRAGHMTPLLTPAGDAGVLVHDHGDGRIEPTALFNNSGQRGAGLALLRQAITERGANYVECFGPALPKMYATLGFRDGDVYPFDPGEAPAGWDHARFDEPDYHTMRLKGRPISRADDAGGLDLDAVRAAAQAAGPAWWARYGKEAWAAFLVAGGFAPPGGVPAQAPARRYDPAQPRDFHGRWGSGGGSHEGLPWTASGDTVTYGHSLGLPREQEPQFSGTIAGRYRPPAEIIPAFRAFLAQRGVAVTARRLPARDLKPVKATGSRTVIEGIAGRLRSGKLADTKPLIVSSDGYVIDGTQTWAARRLADAHGGRAGLPPGIPVLQADVPAAQLLPLATAFTKQIGMPGRKAGEEADPAFTHGPPVPADTLAKYRRADGSWTPEREILHARIVAEALAGHHPVAHPVATFLGGGPASGKSTLAAPANSVHIDADAIKAKLPEYGQMIAAGDPQAAAYTHEESSAVAKQIQAAATAQHMNFTLDGTGDTSYAKMAAKVDAARAAGYKVAAKYVTIGADEAVRRARLRAEKSGRMVPETVIREVHKSVSSVLPQLLAHHELDSAELWDNHGRTPKLVGDLAPGGSWVVHDQAAWQAFLDKAGGPGSGSG